MPNKIENTLSHDQLAAFLDELRGLAAKPTLAQIQATAERHGVSVSLMGARTFRNNTFKAHLERLASGREKSAQILAAVREGGAHPLDAVEESAAADLLDAYTSGEEVDTAAIVKIALQLRASIAQRKETERSDRDLDRKLREAESRIAINEKNRLIAEERARKLERERKAWELAQKKIAQANEQLRSAAPEDADAVRARVVDLLDDVLGIKPRK